MKGRFISCFLIPLSAGLLGLSSVNLQAAGLIEVFKQAVENDATIQAAHAQLMADLEAVPQSRALLLPNISVSANTQTTDRESSGVDDERFNSNGYAAQITQPLFRADSWYQLKVAKATNNQAYAVYSDARQDLIVRVATAYFNSLRAEDNLSSAIASETAFAQQLEQAKERFNVGLIAATDVYEAQASFDLAQVERITRLEERNNSYALLTTLTDQPYSEIDPLDKNIPILGPAPAALEPWIETALSNNYLLEASKHQVEAAKKQIKVEKSGHLPTIDARASYAHSEVGGRSFLGNETDTQTFALELNFPLFEGGGQQSRVREAHYRHQLAKDNYVNQYRQVTQDIQTQHRTVSTDVLRVKARLAALKSTASALEATQGGYEVGTRNIVDVLQAENRRFESQRDYANAIYDYILNQLTLKRTAGSLSEEDLLALDQWLQAKGE